MRRLVAAQRELHQGGETSQSDWSEEEEEEEVQYLHFAKLKFAKIRKRFAYH
jgi:hypothetical protein